MTQAALQVAIADLPSCPVDDGRMIGRRLRCILMDNSGVARRVLRHIAAESRFDIDLVEVASIEETRTALADGHADLLLLDGRVPEGDGITVARLLGQEAGLRAVPVIVITGETSQAAAVRALRSGAADFLSRNELTTELFDQAVENALERAARVPVDQMALVASLSAENETLRRVVLRNMRLLKGQSMPLLSFAWRMIGGELPERAVRDRSARNLAHITRNVTALIDDTVILAATHRATEVSMPVDLSEIVAGILADEAGEIHESRAHIRVAPLPTLTVRASHMILLFEELLLTAVRASRLGRVPEIEIDSSLDPDGNPVIRIVEHGLPLSARKQSLGERFRLLSEPPEQTRDAHSWSLCQRIAEKNGGQFRVADASGTGSTVLIRFPKAMLS